MTQLNCSTALVVEDQPAIRKLIVEALRRAGCTVKEAKDGAVALQELADSADALDLLLLDLSLPLVGGLEVLQHVRAQSPGLPVIAMSASREDLGDARAAGARETLAKPFDISELLERVESCQQLTSQTTSATIY